MNYTSQKTCQDTYQSINSILSGFEKDCLSMNTRDLAKRISDSYVSFT